jgi:hypothetical protein
MTPLLGRIVAGLVFGLVLIIVIVESRRQNNAILKDACEKLAKGLSSLKSNGKVRG